MLSFIRVISFLSIKAASTSISLIFLCWAQFYFLINFLQLSLRLFLRNQKWSTIFPTYRFLHFSQVNKYKALIIGRKSMVSFKLFVNNRDHEGIFCIWNSRIIFFSGYSFVLTKYLLSFLAERKKFIGSGVKKFFHFFFHLSKSFSFEYLLVGSFTKFFK